LIPDAGKAAGKLAYLKFEDGEVDVLIYNQASGGESSSAMRRRHPGELLFMEVEVLAGWLGPLIDIYGEYISFYGHDI
jgi:hypothetical protein